MHEKGHSALTFSTKSFYLILGLSFIVSFLGLFIPVMEVDASQYASMSLELLQSNSFLQLTDLGENYLDKPPLLFWLSAISIKLLGNTSFAFKFPSFLLAWFSVYALYRWVQLYYEESIARYAAIAYTCSVGFLIFTNDIRTDTLLISFVVLSLWQASQWLKNKRIKHLIFASIFAGFALLAKGPIGLMVPILAIFPHLILKKELRKVFQLQVLLIPLVLLFVLTPMLIGLYQQWGMHGIQFFFWEQSFGRITGENVWENDASYFYFLHNIIWVVLPFTLFFIYGFIHTIRNWKEQNEYISFFGLVLPFIALSLSHYKLPHYIYVLLPFCALLIAKGIHHWLNQQNKKGDWALYFGQSLLIAAILILPILIFIAFPGNMLSYAIYILGVIALFLSFYLLGWNKKIFVLNSIGAYLLVAFIINSHGYPHLLNYQGSSEIAFYLKKNNPENLPVYQHNIWWRAFHYYSGGIIPQFNFSAIDQEAVLVVTDEKGLEKFDSYSNKSIERFDHFNITRLSLDFLNPKTRKQKLNSLYLITIKKTP